MKLLLLVAVCGLLVCCFILHLRISILERKVFDDSDSLND